MIVSRGRQKELQVLVLDRVLAAESLHQLHHLAPQIEQLSGPTLQDGAASSLPPDSCCTMACWPKVFAAAAKALLVLTNAIEAAGGSQHDHRWFAQQTQGEVAWTMNALLDTAAFALVFNPDSTNSQSHGLTTSDSVCAATSPDVEGKCALRTPVHTYAHLCNNAAAAAVSLCKRHKNSAMLTERLCGTCRRDSSHAPAWAWAYCLAAMIGSFQQGCSCEAAPMHAHISYRQAGKCCK